VHIGVKDLSHCPLNRPWGNGGPVIEFWLDMAEHLSLRAIHNDKISQ